MLQKKYSENKNKRGIIKIFKILQNSVDVFSREEWEDKIEEISNKTK